MVTGALWLYLVLLIVLGIATTISDMQDKEPALEIVVDAASFTAFATGVISLQVSTAAVVAQVAGWVVILFLLVQVAASWRGRAKRLLRLRELERSEPDSPEIDEERAIVRAADVSFVVLMGPMVGVTWALVTR